MYSPAEEEPDDRIVKKVGEDTAAKPLLKPMRERVAKAKANARTYKQ